MEAFITIRATPTLIIVLPDVEAAYYCRMLLQNPIPESNQTVVPLFEDDSVENQTACSEIVIFQ